MKKILLILFILTAFSSTAFSYDLSNLDNVSEINFSGTVEEMTSGTFELSPINILIKIRDMLFSDISKNLSLLVKIIAVAVLCGLITNLQTSFGSEGVGQTAFLACFAVIAAMAASIFSSMADIATQAIDRMLLLMQTLIPTIIGLIAANGRPIVANGVSPPLFTIMQIIIYASKNIFLPLVMLVTSLSIVNNLSDRIHISRLISSARALLKWSTGFLLTIFVGVLSLQGFSYAFVDGVAGKTVKYALRNFVPLVGNVLSDSVEAVIASTSILKNAVGLTGVIAVLSISLAPLIKLLALSVIYHLGAGLAEPATDPKIVNLISDIAHGITQIFVIVLTVSVMFVISISMLLVISNFSR